MALRSSNRKIIFLTAKTRTSVFSLLLSLTCRSQISSPIIMLMTWGSRQSPGLFDQLSGQVWCQTTESGVQANAGPLNLHHSLLLRSLKTTPFKA
ncbi:T-box transcription factor tbx2 [Plakobranchus ocellatus]|uniref:T-box transcription factor tbx2 n=1 Tax=Plakobranchus ocellatus TaxID=259542 RepID=A0AAV4DJD4_9GAST|nr:T-box transcription factor tbx2 [Plakobranchus ocellatus]